MAFETWNMLVVGTPEYVEFMTEFPLNATGKIMKQELKYVPK